MLLNWFSSFVSQSHACLMQEWKTEWQEAIWMTSYPPLDTHKPCQLSLETTIDDPLKIAWVECHFLMRSQKSLISSFWKMLSLGFITTPHVGQCAFMNGECLCSRVEKLSPTTLEV